MAAEHLNSYSLLEVPLPKAQPVGRSLELENLDHTLTDIELQELSINPPLCELLIALSQYTAASLREDQ